MIRFSIIGSTFKLNKIMDIYLINSLYLLNNCLLWIYNNNYNYICFNPNVFRQKIKLSLKIFNLIM